MTSVTLGGMREAARPHEWLTAVLLVLVAYLAVGILGAAAAAVFIAARFLTR